MAKLWTLGGLSFRELIARTWTETWHDSVFGQAGRMAFYHFLAIFPALLILLQFARNVPFGSGMLQAAAKLIRDFLPGQSSALVQEMMSNLNSNVPIGLHWVAALAGTLWAAMNGTWALIFGLNRAYEVEEHRNWRELARTITGLTFGLTFVAGFGLLCLLTAARIGGVHEGRHWPIGLEVFEWLLLGVSLMFSFALIYRFAPNLRDHQWQWSTPGSICALILWAVATAALHIYFNHINDYTRTYGRLNRVVMLMLWLYFTNAAILIGGEMNSEIEKAADRDGTADRSGT